MIDILPDFGLGGSISMMASLQMFLLQVAILLPVLLPAAWLLLRRQKTLSPHPFPEP